MSTLVAPPSQAMIEAAREGLTLFDGGYGGRGLQHATVRTAERIAKGEALSWAWWRKCAAWHARHGAQAAEVEARRVPSPARVAWLLWGGADAPAHARAVLRSIERTARNPRRGEGEGPGALEGLDAREQYEALRWGIKARRALHVETTSSIAQPLVELGKLAGLFLVDGDGVDVGVLQPRSPAPALAVGARDNRLYIVGGSTDSMAEAGDWGQPGRLNLWVRRTDYEARKGKGSREVVYWYHDHEKPYPRYTVRADGRPHLLGGGYHVEAAGIVG